MLWDAHIHLKNDAIRRTDEYRKRISEEFDRNTAEARKRAEKKREELEQMESNLRHKSAPKEKKKDLGGNIDDDMIIRAINYAIDYQLLKKAGQAPPGSPPPARRRKRTTAAMSTGGRPPRVLVQARERALGLSEGATEGTAEEGTGATTPGASTSTPGGHYSLRARLQMTKTERAVKIYRRA